MFMQMLDDSLSRVLDEASFVGARFRLHGLQSFFFLINLFYLFIYFTYLFLAALGLRCCVRVSLVAASGGHSSLRCEDFSLWWLPSLQSTGSRHTGFSSCGSRAL